MSAKHESETFRVCAECHLLTPMALLLDGDVCLPCRGTDVIARVFSQQVVEHRVTRQQLAEVTAERDALKRRVEELEQRRELNAKGPCTCGAPEWCPA